MSRRRTASAGLNLDSLLDTLTNVVGFLIILLVLMQLGVGDAVERIRAVNPEAFALSDGDVAAARDQARAQTERTAALEARLPPAEAARAAARAALEAARPKTDPAAPQAVSLAEAQQRLEEAKRLLAEREAAFAALDEELARITALLDKTPAAVRPAGVYVALPDPHAVPAGFEPLYIFCKDGRALPVNLPAVQKAAKDRIEANRSTFLWQDPSRQPRLSPELGLKDTRRQGPAPAKPAIVYDGRKIAASFSARPLAAHDVLIKIKTYDTSTRLNLLLEPQPRRGETKAQLASGHSALGTTFFNLSARKQKVYAQFLVAPDAFDAYLEARALADKYGIPAGWHILYGAAWETALNQPIQVHPRAAPPPQPAPAAPAAPKPPPKLLD